MPSMTKLVRHPVGHLRAFKRVADDGSEAGDPQAELGGIGLLLGQGRKLVLARAGLLGGGHFLFPGADGLFVGPAARVQKAVAGDAVVGPVGDHAGAHGDGQPVHERHDHDEDGQTQNAVRDHAIDLLREGKALRGLLHRLGHHVADGVVARHGDGAFGIVVERVLHGLAGGVDRLQVGRGKLERVDGALLALQKLDGVPARRGGGHARAEEVGDLLDGALHFGDEAQIGRGSRLLLGRIDGRLDKFVHALALERGRLDHRAAQALRELRHVDLVAVFAHEIHHVERHDHRKAQVEDLRRQVKVALEVRGVHEVDHDVGTALQKVVTRHDLLGRVRRERVDARQVRDDHVLVARVLALLLFHGHARPVAHVLVGTGQVVEHRGLAAVRVAGKRQTDRHIVAPFYCD